MDNFIEKILEYYSGKKDILSDRDKKKKKRIDFIIELKLNDFAVSDKNVIAQTKKHFESSVSTILGEISIAERIIALRKNDAIDAQKAWIRYMIHQGALESYRIAREKNDAYSMTMAMNIIGKHYNTDKEDVYSTMYDEIVPFIPEITSNPAVIGIKPIKNLEKVKQKLKEKYTNSIDIDYEEITKKENISE